MPLQKTLEQLRSKLDSSTFTDLSSSIDQLQQENSALRARISELELQLNAEIAADKLADLSEVEEAILDNCLDAGIAGFLIDDIVSSLSYSKREIENGVRHLLRKDILHRGCADPHCANYYLTATGKQYLNTMKQDDYSF